MDQIARDVLRQAPRPERPESTGAPDHRVQQAEAEQGVDAPVSTKVVLTPDKAKLWTYGPDMIAKLTRIDYAKLNEAQSDWIDRWNEIFGM